MGVSSETELARQGHGLERRSRESVGLGVAVPEHLPEMPGCEVSACQAEESGLHSGKMHLTYPQEEDQLTTKRVVVTLPLDEALGRRVKGRLGVLGEHCSAGSPRGPVCRTACFLPCPVDAGSMVCASVRRVFPRPQWGGWAAVPWVLASFGLDRRAKEALESSSPARTFCKGDEACMSASSPSWKELVLRLLALVYSGWLDVWTHLILKTNPRGHRMGDWALGTGQCGEAVSGGLGLASSRWLLHWCFLYGPNLARPGRTREHGGTGPDTGAWT